MTDHDTTPGAPELGYVPGNDFTECVREGCPAFHHQYSDRLYFQGGDAPPGVHITPPCASCGEPSIHRIILRGEPTPVCLRHLNHWRTPGAPETEALFDEPTARLILRQHYPTGPYLPVGHLDGDCKQGCGEWPCEQAHKALIVIGYFTAEVIRDAGYLSPTEAATRDAAQRGAGWDEGWDARTESAHTDRPNDRRANPYRIGGAS